MSAEAFKREQASIAERAKREGTAARTEYERKINAIADQTNMAMKQSAQRNGVKPAVQYVKASPDSPNGLGWFYY